MTSKTKFNSAFEKYFSQQAARKKAITPNQIKELISELRKELLQQGRLPLPVGPVRLDVTHRVVKAAILANSPVWLPKHLD